MTLVWIGAELQHWRVVSTGPLAVEGRPGLRRLQSRLSWENLKFLAGLGAHELKLSMLAAERRRFLAAIGRRSRAQALARREPERRYPVLLTVLEEAAVGVLDEVVQLYDQAVSAAESRA